MNEMSSVPEPAMLPWAEAPVALPWWRRWRNRTPARPTIGRYATKSFLQRHRVLCYSALILFCLIYGYAFAIFGRYFLAQMLMPLVPVVAIIVWLLPNTERPLLRPLVSLTLAFVVALLCWPDYIALALPGLPWITALRLVSIPLAIVLLVSLSVSARFRAEMKDRLSAVPLMWKFLATFLGIAFLSIALSKDPLISLNKFLVAQLVWTSVFFSSVYVFSKPGRVFLFGRLIWGTVLFQALVASYEVKYQKLPWAGRIPSFLKVEDEHIQNLLAGANGRSATGLYRTQSKFTTALGLGEFLALTTPFVLHLAFTAKRWWVRLAAAATLPVIFFVAVRCDSRIAMIGFFMSVMLYVLVWGVLRVRKKGGSFVGMIVVMTYPLMFAAFIATSFIWKRLRVMVWGGGAQQASTEARKTMYREGIPMVIKNPIGHGMGQGAETLGFYSPSGTLTIDTYYLAVALEYGVIGFIAYYGMIIIGIYQSSRTLLFARNREVLYLAPISIALINFFIIKSVFSQQENHPLVFMFLGIVVALVWRAKGEAPMPASPPLTSHIGYKKLAM